MFVPLERLRRRRARAAEVRELRDAIAGTSPPDAAERAAAEQLLATKLALAAATGAVTSCAGCARGKPAERGGYPGGDCCSGRSALVFSEDELAALAHTGTRPRDLVPPGEGEQHGCAFRGPRGCSLAIANRPSLCVRYACDGLQRELHARGRLDAVEPLAVALGAQLAAYAAARAARKERELEAALIAELARA